jgi:methylglutaconyl-CoA hydratase
MADTKGKGILTVQVIDKLGIIEFYNPSGNALDSFLLSKFCLELEHLGSHPDVTVVLIQSRGDGAFCAGASFDELLKVTTPAESTTFFSGFARLINCMRQCPKPIIGKVHGKAVGGGVGLIASCDYVLASDAAGIKLSELSIGIAPLVIAPAISRKIGASGLSEMALAPLEWKTAQWALQKGLYSQVLTERDALDKETMAFAQQMAEYSTEALKELKAALWTGTEDWNTLLFERAGITGKLALSETTQSILRKFKQKS